jgi:membrane protease YdiL (CAAX protease family)
MFAWGYAYCGSLWASVLAHFLFNLIAFGSGVGQYS